MAKQSTMDFSMSYFSAFDEFVYIGTVDKTDWRLHVSCDSYGNRSVEIVRTTRNGEVKIDGEVAIEGRKVLSVYDYPLVDGQEKASFIYKLQRDHPRIYSRSIMKGYIRVHYNSNCAPTSTNDEDTFSDNGFDSSIAEKFNPSLQLTNDFLHLLDDPDSFSDATLLCDSAKIPVHKVILSARSPVFATMLHQMQEGREGVVDIVDMQRDVLEAMLRYVYSGKTDHLTSSMAGDLLFAADKYQLGELKLICVHQLKVSMAANNVFRSLVLGDLHDKSLKEHAVEFICKYTKFSDLETTEEWQSLMKEHPYLAIEVTTTVVKHLQDK